MGWCSNIESSDPLSAVAGCVIPFRLRRFLMSGELLFIDSEALKMPSWKNSRELVEIFLAFALFPAVLALLGIFRLWEALDTLCGAIFRRH